MRINRDCALLALTLTLVSGAGHAQSLLDPIQPPPGLVILDVIQSEGDAGATQFNFGVFLNIPAPLGGVTFDIQTRDIEATAGLDFVPRSLTGQHIPEGQAAYTFSVSVLGDVTIEPNEVFAVDITNLVGATEGDVQGIGTIVNDDLASAIPEPTTLALLGIGLAGLGFSRRRRLRNS